MIRESRSIKSPIQPLSTPVSGEHATRPIPSVCRRGESDDEKSSACIAESGDRPSPVFLLPKCRSFLSGDRLSIADKARAFPAGNNLGREHSERIRPH